MAEKATSRVGLVFVSHSNNIAEGLVDLAGQMAPAVRLIAAGGTDAGGIGTSFDKISAAIDQADSGSGVVILCDLGSAILTAETARDFLEESAQQRVHIVDAPLIEGGVAAAVAAEIGGDVLSVIAAAESAWQKPPQEAANASSNDPETESDGVETITRTVILVNKDGLHARPAAEFVSLVNSFSVPITVNGTDASSLLSIMSLGLARGSSVHLASSDPTAGPALAALAGLLESGFGED